MKALLFVLFFSAGFQFCFAQEDVHKQGDSLYKEDQFYAGVTYNLLGSMPKGVSQSSFSLGFQLGYIKDMPINKRRNLAIGLGIGYSVNSYNQNLLINKDGQGEITYTVLGDDDTYNKNKFSSHLIEFPLEFRWRESTPLEYNFWRVYTGFKLGYMLGHTAKYKDDLGVLKYTNIGGFNKIQYGLTLSVGYDTWNLYLYYGLNPIFSKNANLEGKKIDINAIKIGLMFYIL